MAASASLASAARVSRAGVLAQIFMAALLGVVLIGGVGFWQVEAVHNAAHDTRHSAGFPCH